MRLWPLILVVAACGGKSEPDTGSGSAPVLAPDAASAKPDAAVAPAPVRPEHAVFSFVDNRHAAHRYYGGELLLDGGDVGFARYTRFGLPQPQWRIGHVVEGARAALPDRQATLEVPMDGAMAKEVDRIEMRVAAKAGQRLAVRINGRPVGKDAKSSRLDLAAGWQTVTVPIEAGRLGVGENQVMLETTGPAKDRIAIEWLRFASKGKEMAGDPRQSATFDKTSITLARDATLLWYLTVPEGAHLVAEIGDASPAALKGRPGAPCVVDVRATTSDDSFVGGELSADKPRVDLTKLSGRVVGLTLSARECARAQIKQPEIRIHGAAPAERAKTAAAKYVVLWVMDSLRADKVPAFTPGARAQTPNLDELAKTSAVFRQYYVQGNESQVSHASMWTGLYPAVHGVKLEGTGMSKLPAKLDVIAQEVADAGLHTIAVTGNGYVNTEGGYARGFKEFRNLMREANVNGVIYGKTIVDLALARLELSRGNPTYLMFGTIDNHAPWLARKPWIDTYSPNYKGPFVDFAPPEALGFKPSAMGCSVIPPAPEIERLRAIYDSAISYQDQLLGQVVAKLKEWGIWDQTLFVITSDHGDEFFEDGRCGHGGSLRDSLVRVPLLIHDPARFPAGVIEEGAEGVDLFPTILEALHQPIGDAAQGQSLIGLARGEGRGWARPSYASQYEYGHAMRIGRWKLVVASGLLLLFDLVGDPQESANVVGKHPVERRMLTDNLGLFLALRTQWNKRTWGVTTSVTAAGAAALDQARTEDRESPVRPKTEDRESPVRPKTEDRESPVRKRP
jgi:choline-sulfatase